MSCSGLKSAWTALHKNNNQAAARFCGADASDLTTMILGDHDGSWNYNTNLDL